MMELRKPPPSEVRFAKRFFLCLAICWLALFLFALTFGVILR